MNDGCNVRLARLEPPAAFGGVWPLVVDRVLPSTQLFCSSLIAFYRQLNCFARRRSRSTVNSIVLLIVDRVLPLKDRIIP